MEIISFRLLRAPSGKVRFAPQFWTPAAAVGVYYSLTIQVLLEQFSTVGIQTDTINEPIRTLFFWICVPGSRVENKLGCYADQPCVYMKIHKLHHFVG